jgi:hypothetical protein
MSIRPSPVSSPVTAVGVRLLFKSPVPSCPPMLSPQQTVLPFVSRAHVWNNPTAMATTPAGRDSKEGDTFIF